MTHPLDIDENDNRSYEAWGAGRRGVWEPGVPLYTHPTNATDPSVTQYTRHIIQLIDEEHWAEASYRQGHIREMDHLVCRRCLVSWHEDQGGQCWSCGKDIWDVDA